MLLFQAEEDILLFNERYVKGEQQIMFNELNIDIPYDENRRAIR